MTDIDAYIAQFPKETQKLLKQMRATIRKAAPAAEEKISYGMPTFYLQGNLVHFAGYKNHIGFYPAPSGIAAFSKELSSYVGAKGSVQFPLDEALPLATITKIVKFRLKENLEKNPAANFAAALSKPAQSALVEAGVKTLKQLAKHTEEEILELHGMGPSSLPKLKAALKAAGLAFKKR